MLLLDTHALVWWLFDRPELPPAVRELIAACDEPVYVSAASAWEISAKVRIGKLPDGRSLAENFEAYLQLQSFQPLPVLPEHVRIAAALLPRHKDPFDRLIAAQAQCEKLTVVTADPAFKTLGVPVFW